MTKRRGKSQAERKLKARASVNESQAKRKRQVFCRFDEFVILSAAKYPQNQSKLKEFNEFSRR